MNSNYDKNQPIEAPFAPDLTHMNPSDNLTPSQDVLSLDMDSKRILSENRTTIQQAIEYIKRTKQVISILHEVIDTLKQKDQLQKQLLKHCLTQLENPKPRNQELIIKAIKQHLGEK